MNELAAGTRLKGPRYTYTIIRALGQGSFGITYLATVKIAGDLGDLDVYVALKEFFMRGINSRHDGESSVTGSEGNDLFENYKKKFLKEARNLSSVRHQGVIKVMEYFEANSTAYYTMEYVQGGSLDDLIKSRGRLDAPTAMSLMRKIAAAVQYMHNSGMVHLDIKPGNIMMKPDGTPVLIDFGLSKQYDQSGRPESTTSIGAGTPGYAPIEQSSAKAHDGLPVTMDLYALGATLFKMLTGDRPPESTDLLETGFPPRPDYVDPTAWAAVEIAMKPLKRQRPQSVKEWVDRYFPETTEVLHPDIVVPTRPASKPLRRPSDSEVSHAADNIQKKREIDSRKIALIVIGLIVIWLASVIMFKNCTVNNVESKTAEPDTIARQSSPARIDLTQYEHGPLPAVEFNSDSEFNKWLASNHLKAYRADGAIAYCSKVEKDITDARVIMYIAEYQGGYVGRVAIDENVTGAERKYKCENFSGYVRDGVLDFQIGDMPGAATVENDSCNGIFGADNSEINFTISKNKTYGEIPVHDKSNVSKKKDNKSVNRQSKQKNNKHDSSATSKDEDKGGPGENKRVVPAANIRRAPV